MMRERQTVADGEATDRKTGNDRWTVRQQQMVEREKRDQQMERDESEQQMKRERAAVCGERRERQQPAMERDSSRW